MKTKFAYLIGAMALAISIVELSLAVLSAAATPSAAPSTVTWVDNFDSSSLNSRWSWIREDNNHWSLTTRPGFLRISTQQGTLLDLNNATNLLVQNAPVGEFEIQTHVIFTPTANFQIAGLLVYQDDDNFLMLGRAYCGAAPPRCVGNGIYFDHEEQGNYIGTSGAMATTLVGEAYLRIVRHGTVYTGYVSENGTDWTLVQAHTVVSGFVPSKIGLAAFNQSVVAPEIPADFDYFRFQYDDVITIGVAAPFSGGSASLGWQVANSVQLAISSTNAAGGINIGGLTYTLTLVTTDDGCNPSGAITAANTLLSAGVVAVVGHVCSSASMGAQPIYNAAGVPMVSAISTDPPLTHQGYTTTFRTISHDGASPALLATHFRSWLALPKSAIVDGPGRPWGDQPGTTYSDTFAALGGTITSRRQVASADEFTTTLTAIKAENPNAIFYIDSDSNRAGQFSQIAYNLPMTTVIIGWTSWDNTDDSVLATYAGAAGSAAAENDYAALQYRRYQDMPGWTTFLAAYQAAGFPNQGSDPGISGPFAYDAARIIVAAIERANSANPPTIRNQIAATKNYQGVVGTYQGFDADGDVIPQWAWLERYQGGQWVLLHPTKIFLPIVLRN